VKERNGTLKLSLNAILPADIQIILCREATI
jgi:hypothetical protein